MNLKELKELIDWNIKNAEQSHEDAVNRYLNRAMR